MQLFLFLSCLIFHIVVCKKVVKSFTTPFAIYGIIWFTVLTFTRLPIIIFEPYDLLTVFVFIGSYVAFLVPGCFATRKKVISIFGRKPLKVSIIALRRIFKVLLPITLFFSVLYIVLMVRHYGGLSFIIRNAYYVRHDAMGKEIVPVAVSYGLGFGYAAAGIASYLLFFSKTSFIQKLFYLVPMALSISTDLLTSGRLGILLYSIIYISALLLKICCTAGVARRKLIRILAGGLTIGIVVLFIPKYLRDVSVGGSDYSGYLKYLANDEMKHLPLIGPFMHFYTYITGPLAAFDRYITSFSDNFTLGEAQFLPLAHFLARFLGGESNYTLLYDFVDIPFSTNIYTYLREAYSDFGMLGVFLTPFAMGAIGLLAGRVRFRAVIMNFMLSQFTFIFCIFSIFYFPFSQGGPALGFFLYFLVAIVMNFMANPSFRGADNGQLYYRYI